MSLGCGPVVCVTKVVEEKVTDAEEEGSVSFWYLKEEHAIILILTCNHIMSVDLRVTRIVKKQCRSRRSLHCLHRKSMVGIVQRRDGVNRNVVRELVGAFIAIDGQCLVADLAIENEA